MNTTTDKLLELRALLLLLKEFEVKKYKDQHVELSFATVPGPVSGTSQVYGFQTATSEEISAGTDVPEELRRVNKKYFDPALGLEINYKPRGQ